MQLKKILLLSAAFAALTLTFACSDKEEGGGNDDDKGVMTLEELQTAIDNASSDAANPTKIVLGADIEASAVIAIGDRDGKAPRAVSLDGRGHTILQSADLNLGSGSGVMIVWPNSKLVLADITLDGTKSTQDHATLLDVYGTAVLGNGTTVQNLKSSAGTSGVYAYQQAFLTVEEGAAFKNIENNALGSSGATLRLNGGSFSGNGTDLFIRHYDLEAATEFAKWPAVEGKLKLGLQSFSSNSTVATAVGDYAFPSVDIFSLVWDQWTSQRELVLEDGAIKIKEKQ